MSDREVVEAIQRQRLADHARSVLADPPRERDAALAQQAIDTCGRIAADVTAAQQTALDSLAAAGIPASARAVGATAQRHEYVLDVARADAPAAAEVLADRSYEPELELSGGAQRSRLCHAHELAVRRTDRATTVARLRWRDRPAPSSLRRLLVPTAADWTMVSVPAWTWWCYPLLRPVRLLLERAGRRSGDHALLEPFLATPDTLIDPLLDAAEVTADDIVVDLGCGDGRIVVEAAARRGCRAIGIEQSPTMSAAAEQRAASAGLAERVEIVCGDGLDADLSRATVVLMFLPMVIARRIVPELLASLSSGTRVLVHEQGRLPADMPTPHTSLPLIGEDAVSVAHRWVVGAHPSTDR